LARWVIWPAGYARAGHCEGIHGQTRPYRQAFELKGFVMTAIAHTLIRTFRSRSDIDALKQIALFCGAGLLVSLLALTYGLDLSPGFF
jgi:hypothetical protein